METIQQLLDFIQSIPPSVYTGGSAILIVLAVEKFKKWIEREREKREWVYVLVSTTLAFLAELGQYVANGGGSEWTALGSSTATVLGVIVTIYHFPRIGVKALHQTIEDARQGRALRAGDAPSAASTVNGSASATVLDGEFTGR